MPQRRSRYVLLCQQLLALGAVLVVLASAARVVTLDIVAPPHTRVAADHPRR
ncbi:MAG: hypothetical protein ACTHOK_01805 [Nocardioidaceae bacterium]